MRVLMVGSGGVSAVGGVAGATAGLVEGLAPLADRLWFAALGAGPGDEGVQGTRVETIPVTGTTRLALLSTYAVDSARLIRAVRQRRAEPEIVHGQGLARDGIAAVRLARHLRVPAVVTVHGFLDTEARRYSDSVRAAASSHVMRRTLGGASGVILVSPFRRNDVEKKTAGLVAVIENALNHRYFTADEGGREPRSRRRILIPGVFRRLKRIEDGVEVAARLMSRWQDVDLQILGVPVEAAYYRAVEEKVRALGLAGRTAFGVATTAEEMIRAYREATLVLLTSELENAPQVVAEAMAVGTPVIASDTGGVRWMLDDLSEACCCPVGAIAAFVEKAERLLADPLEWERVSKRAQDSARRFRADCVAERTLRFYERVLTRNAEKGADGNLA